MIDPRYPGASWFLWIAGGFFLIAFAIPLLVAPLTWARWFRWRVPADTELAVYLGRSLGALAIGVVGVCLRAAPDPSSHRAVFEMVIVSTGMLCATHVWGAIRRAQPWTENVEIALYGFVAAYAAWLYRSIF